MRKTPATRRVQGVPTSNERSAAALARLRKEIELRYGSVTAFAPNITTVKKHALLDYFNGTSMPRFDVVLEILGLLGMSFDELMRRADADLSADHYRED